jgi:hypothetical protein
MKKAKTHMWSQKGSNIGHEALELITENIPQDDAIEDNLRGEKNTSEHTSTYLSVWPGGAVKPGNPKGKIFPTKA